MFWDLLLSNSNPNKKRIPNSCLAVFKYFSYFSVGPSLWCPWRRHSRWLSGCVNEPERIAGPAAKQEKRNLDAVTHQPEPSPSSTAPGGVSRRVTFMLHSGSSRTGAVLRFKSNGSHFSPRRNRNLHGGGDCHMPRCHMPSCHMPRCHTVACLGWEHR